MWISYFEQAQQIVAIVVLAQGFASASSCSELIHPSLHAISSGNRF